MNKIKTKTVTSKRIYDNNLKYELIVKETPNTILGVWIINHNFKSMKREYDLKLKGNFEINVWYSYANDSKTGVAKRTIEYDEIIPNIFNVCSDYRVRILGNPTCQKTSIENDTIIVDVFKQFEIEIIDKIDILIEKNDEFEDIEELNPRYGCAFNIGSKEYNINQLIRNQKKIIERLNKYD